MASTGFRRPSGPYGRTPQARQLGGASLRGKVRRCTDRTCRCTDRTSRRAATRGLTLIELGARNNYSKSSWERWLNGRRLPSEEAVRRLLDVAGAEDHERVLRLLAEATAAEAAAGAPGPALAEVSAEDRVAPPVSSRRWPDDRARWVVLAAGAVVLVLAVVVGIWYWPSSASRSAPRAQTKVTGVAAQQTAPACRAAGCAARDPQAEGCGADARTIAMTAIAGAYIYIRYSPSCQAAWGRMTDAAAGDTIRIIDPGHQEAYRIHYGLDGYSPMITISATDWVRACGVTKTGSGCTDVITDPSKAAPLAPGRPSASAGSPSPSGRHSQ